MWNLAAEVNHEGGYALIVCLNFFVDALTFVTDYYWEFDFKLLSAFFQSPDFRFGPGGWGRRSVSTLEVLERHTNNVGILWRKLIGDVLWLIATDVLFRYFSPFFVVSHQVITSTTESTTYHLLTKQLRTKGANTTNMRDGIGIPAFGQHTHTHHAANVGTQRALLAHAVHDFAHDV